MQQKFPLFWLDLTIFVNIVGFGMVFPLLPYYAKTFAATDFVIGILASLFAVAQFLFSPFWGVASDRFGRKPLISIALLGTSVAFLVFGLANSLWLLFLARFLQGLFAAAAMPVARAYVADVTKGEERLKEIGKLGASLALGFLAGPAIGGLLSGITVATPFFAAAVLAFVNFFSVQLFLPESNYDKTKKIELGKELIGLFRLAKGLKSPLIPLYLFGFLWAYGLSNHQVAIPLFAIEELGLTTTSIGLLFTVTGATSAVVQGLFLSKIVNATGKRAAVIFGLLLMSLGLFLIPATSNAIFLATTMIVLAAGSAITRPTSVTLLSEETKAEQGVTMGISNAYESVGRILGPILGGFFFQTQNNILPFIFAGFSLAFATVVITRVYRFLK